MRGQKRSGCKAVAALAGLAVSAPAAAAWAGPVQIISQERFVRANANGVTEEKTAPGAGRFNESVSAELAGDGSMAQASASMDSTLGDDGFTFAGTLSYSLEGDETADGIATAQAVVVFALDEPRRFKESRTETVTNDDPFLLVESPFEFTSHESNGNPGGIEVTSDEGEDLAGTLSAGEYRLVVPVRIRNDGGGAELQDASLDYDIALELSAIDGGDGGGDGGGETPIPLPPAAWTALSIMGVGLLNRWRKSRLA